MSSNENIIQTTFEIPKQSNSENITANAEQESLPITKSEEPNPKSMNKRYRRINHVVEDNWVGEKSLWYSY
jgi:hypothetical protein